MKENCFTLKKARSKLYPVETITDAGYMDDLALLVNTPAQAESLQHSVEQTAIGIGLYGNLDKTEFTCFNQDGASSVNSKPLKLVHQLKYLGSDISSIKSNVNISKVWTAIDRLSTIWKSNLLDNIKGKFFQAVAMSVLLDGCTTWTPTKCLERKQDGKYTRMLHAI